MPRETEKERVKKWQRRVEEAERVRNLWAEVYQVELCEQMYYGHQWEDENAERTKYTINLIFPTVEIKIPTLFFTRPVVNVEPRPAKSDEPGSLSYERAKLMKDTVNTMIQDPDVCFQKEGQRGLKEAFWAYAVIEVGYTADYIDNPNAGKPVLDEESQEPLLDSNGDEVQEPQYYIRDEGLYIKRIPWSHFFVSVSSKMDIEKNDYCGYAEWHYPKDLIRNKKYKNTSQLKATSRISDVISPPDAAETAEERERRRGMIKIYKIWDIRRKKKYVFPEGGEKFFIDGEPFSFLPFADLRFHERTDEWYPVPPIFNWISPQKELNETREQQRKHRKRFNRRYIITDQNMTPADIKKLESDEDGVYVKGASKAVEPVPDAPLDSAVARNIPLTKEDMREISGIGGDQRSVAESETATQANIIDVRSQIRESFGKHQIGEWLSKIAFLVLRTICEKMALSFWIEVSVDEFSEGAEEEARRVGKLWQQIHATDLGELNVEVTIDIGSLSPLTEEKDKADFFNGLAILGNPQFGGLLAGSDVLLRKALAFFGIKSEREITEIKKALQMNLMMQAQAAAQQSGTPSRAGLPGNAAIAKQLGQQIPVEMGQ
jgi:hypothetical protein